MLLTFITRWIPVFACLAPISLATAQTSPPLAVAGRLLLSDDFAKLPPPKKLHSLNSDWQQRLSFGKWTSLDEGGVRAENIPEDGHGPVLTYLAPIDDVIIECQFRLPTGDPVDRHFRIFLDHPEYRGHTIAAIANESSDFQPVGASLLHNPKTDHKDVVTEVRFGPIPVTLTPGQWHTMRLELVGDRARMSVDDVVVTGNDPALRTTKNKIGLNPGKAGGDLRNFRVWEAASQ